jgi:hypothetical protein
VPSLPLPCYVPRWGRCSRGRLTSYPWQAQCRLSAAREARRLHPTSMGTPAAQHSAEAGGWASASRSEAGPDTHAFPVPRPLNNVWLVPPRRVSRSARLAVRAGRLRAVAPGQAFAPGFLSKVCIVRGARPVAHPSDGLPGLLPATHESGVGRSLLVRVSSCGLTPSAPVRPQLAGCPQDAQCLRNLSMSKTRLVCNMWYVARPSLWARMLSALPVP